MLLFSPHIIANKLWSATTRGPVNKVFHGLLCSVCIAADAIVLLVGGTCIFGCVQCIRDNQILTALVLGISGIIIMIHSIKCIQFLFTRHTPANRTRIKPRKKQPEAKKQEEQKKEPKKEKEELDIEEDEEEDELAFCQLFRIDEEMCLLVNRVEMCPDETAFIRVVNNDGYTPIYKRKVKRDKEGNRYIVFNEQNYNLDETRTKPIISCKK